MMCCPRCGILLHLDEMSKRIDNLLNENKDSEVFVCKSCKLTRSNEWWDTIENDVNTEEEEIEIAEDLWDEEFSMGTFESPWSD